MKVFKADVTQLATKLKRSRVKKQNQVMKNVRVSCKILTLFVFIIVKDFI